MDKVAIFYGSTSGNTETVANSIAKKLEADTFNVGNNPTDKLSEYNNLILGTSTWGYGDLQDDWDNFIEDLKKADLTDKVIALFGVGDAYSYPDTYVNGMAIIYDAIKEKGCTIVGKMPTEGYEFDESQAVIDGQFVGLALDEDNDGDKTENRINEWVDKLKNKFK